MIHDSSLPTDQRANKAAIKPAEKPAIKPARKLIPTNKSRTRQVRKCVEAVHITNSINLVQRKLINGLLLNAYYELPNQSISTHRIPVTQLVNLIGYDSKNIPYLRDLLKALTSTVIEWDIMNEAGKREWGVSALLASADIIDGVCTYAYSPHLRAKLFNPQFYVLLDIDIVRRFQSGYALALYENCARYRRLGQTPSFPIDVVRSLLGAKDPVYDEFKYLNQRVIQPALREVNTVTDLTLTIEVKREARQVSEIRFLIGGNPQQAMQIEPSIEMAGRFAPNTHPSKSSDTVALGHDMPVIASNEGEAGRGIPGPDKTTQANGRRPVELNPIPARLQNEFCLSAQVAARVCSEHPETAIQGAMDYVLSRYNAGKVKDIGPYFLVALKEGAAIRRTQQDQDREEEAKTKQTAKQKLEAKRFAKAQAEMKWNQSLWARFDALPEVERQAVLDAFLTWLSTSKHKQNIVGIYQRGGLAHPWARAEFLSYLGTLNP